MTWFTFPFDTQGFPARWSCGTAWAESPFWGWLTIVSDLLTFGAYTAIPLIFIYFLRKRPDVPVPKLLWLFAAFIFACGTVHLLEAVIFWWPVYRLSAIVKFLTGIISWATVFALLPLIPIALKFRSPGSLEHEVNQRTIELQTTFQRLERNDERLQLALSAGRMGTWEWDLTTKLMQFDTGSSELTGIGKQGDGFTVDQLLERIHRNDRESSERALRKSAETGEKYQHAFRMYVPNKGYRWLQGRGIVTRNAAGVPERLIGVHFDITEQMVGQETLYVRTRAIEFATNSLVIADARAEDQPIIYVNAAFEELTGYTRKEILGKNCRILQGPETDPKHVKQLRDAIQQRKECQVTILNYARNGKSFWNNLHLAPVSNDQGVVTHFVGVQTNITDRVEYERRLIDAQEVAESASRAKSEFLANMSHEIRTPLTAILGCADSLCRELFGDESQAAAKTIRSQGELLLGILNDILDLSKIEAGKLEIRKESCSIMSIIGDVRSLMEPQATEKGISFTTHFDSHLPEVIETDPLRFRQILLNLASNAIKFTDKGGVQIHVSLKKLEDQALLEVAVSDTGIGIPPNQLSEIFDAFAQVNGSAIRRKGGTGLGLTICQRLVQMLDGELNVTSRLNSGSTFILRLPAEAEELFSSDELTERQIQKDSQESVDVFIPAQVLIAEDTRAIQFMLKRILEPVVYNVVVVENGEEAVEAVAEAQLQGRPFDLVLMDMQMPLMNGYDATAKLRREGFTLPVIALTAGAMAGDRERCLAAGCTDYLAKPVSRVHLLGMISTYCNRSPRTST